MSDKQITGAAKFSRMVDEHRKVCGEKNCVNWKCGGTRHRNIEGQKWGPGWEVTDDE